MALIKCPDCEKEISANAVSCPNCGHPFNKQEVSTKKWSIWCYLSIASVLAGCVTLYQGINKMTRYNSGDYYPYETINAYVGGDAYNYIINGTYSTAFFVLTTMFWLMAIGLIIIHYVSLKKN
ncbi:MAG: zinc ribbon domain-containing protein [Lachnospiraceae bacterium]|nr:zinc ribbon domain-containing protein [Lachnospiraceae bacterium]